ncbi:hypothetical protein ACHWQZ_G013469 [Mnemiopsis leidyi]
MNSRLGAFYLLLAVLTVSSVAFPATSKDSVDHRSEKTANLMNTKSDSGVLAKRDVATMEQSLTDLILDFRDNTLPSRRRKRGTRKRKPKLQKGIFYKYDYPVHG